jgi:predicted nucleic acid-binding protein
MILVDTSVWIDFFRGRNTPRRSLLHELIVGDEDLCAVGIILTEILQGIKDDKANHEMRGYLLEFPLYNPSGVTTYIEAANIYRRCMRKGKTIRTTIACLIAAVAIENELTVLHNDSDFDRIAQCTELRVMHQ